MSPRRGGGGARRRSSNKVNASDKRKLPRDKKAYPAHTSSARLEKMDDDTVRLNKYLADHGVASRRACDELIAKGKVMVDDQPVTQLGTRIDPRVQRVEIDGVILKPEGGQRRYYLLNKPSGVVCTNEEREMRPRAIDLIHDRNKGRIYTVGRLDEDSKGLIILTNDGEFAQRIAHPRHGVIKTYRVRVQGNIPDESVQKVREGVYLSDGRTGGARILVQRRSPKSSTLLVSIHEGKNREVRRIFARVGYKVVDLIRTDIGPLTDRGLKAGHYRALSRSEVEALLHLTTPEGMQEKESEREARAERAPGRGRATTDRSKSREAGRSPAAGRTSSPRRGRGGARRRRR
mgnify:CR=1 FL=1|tara:strand:- start:8870 stop:9910 length:1041 start_codon:yes stop_codon:yes gene_type:complete